MNNRDFFNPQPYDEQCRELTRLEKLIYGKEPTHVDFCRFIYMPKYGRFFYLQYEWHDEVPGNAYELLSEPTHWTDYRTAKRELLTELSKKRQGKKLPIPKPSTKMIYIRRRS